MCLLGHDLMLLWATGRLLQWQTKIMGEAALVNENVALKYVIEIADTLQATDGGVKIVISLLLGELDFIFFTI